LYTPLRNYAGYSVCTTWLRLFRMNRTGNYCFSTKNAALRSKKKTDWLKIRIMCPNGAIYLPATAVHFAYFLILFWIRVHTTTWSMDWFNIIKIALNVVLKASRAVIIGWFSLNEAPLGLFKFISNYLPYFEKINIFFSKTRITWHVTKINLHYFKHMYFWKNKKKTFGGLRS
jgi:hypothetical protein